MASAKLSRRVENPLVNVAPSHVTFEDACDERLRYLEHDRQRKRSTLSDYRNVIRVTCCRASARPPPWRTSPPTMLRR